MVDLAPYYRTRVGTYVAQINGGHVYGPWQRNDFAWLGTMTDSNGHSWAWAWHLDGRSIDTADRGFDLIDFPQAAALAETVAVDG
jgi:hypothetical protein